MSNYQGVGIGSVTCNTRGRCGVQMVDVSLWGGVGLSPSLGGCFLLLDKTTFIVPLQLGV